MSIALVLGGGAPNLTLMSGALAALDARGVKFDVVSSLGAGMLVGLLYAAPKQGDRQRALESTRDLGVADLIYRVFPANYKVFHKSGSVAELYTRWVQQVLPSLESGNRALDSLVNDWTQFVSSTFCPWDLSFWSLGFCRPAPWIESLVDFETLHRVRDPEKFYLSAYCLDEKKMQMFPKDRITADVFRACLSMPLIYPPFVLEGRSYIEGSAYDTFNFEGLFEDEGIEPDLLIVFDVLGRDELLRRPKSLLDAWTMSIIFPLVAMARDDLKLFCLQHLPKHPKTTLLPLEYTIPNDLWPSVLDWSRQNLDALYTIGYDAGTAFFDKYRKELTNGKPVQHRAYPESKRFVDRQPTVASTRRDRNHRKRSRLGDIRG
jgi:NTE family protein